MTFEAVIRASQGTEANWQRLCDTIMKTGVGQVERDAIFI